MCACVSVECFCAWAFVSVCVHASVLWETMVVADHMPSRLGSSSVPDTTGRGEGMGGAVPGCGPWAESQKGHAQGKCHPDKGAASARPHLPDWAPRAVITALCPLSRLGFLVVSPDSTSPPTPTPVWLPPPAPCFLHLRAPTGPGSLLGLFSFASLFFFPAPDTLCSLVMRNEVRDDCRQELPAPR